MNKSEPFHVPDLPGLAIARADAHDYELVYTVMNDARGWLKEIRGIDQWNWLTTDGGKAYVLRRIKEHEVYALLDKDGSIGTVTLQYADSLIWGAQGEDGLAGYIHGLAVARRAAGKGLGKDLIHWAESRFIAKNKFISRLDCMAANPRLGAYYENLGYIRVGQKQFPNGFASTLYERRIIPQ